MGRPLLTREHLRVKAECYFSPTEKQIVEAKAQQSGLAFSAFIREAALGAKITALPSANIQLWQELSRTTANLNQIAKHLNEGKLPHLDPSLLQEIGQQVRALRLDLMGGELD